MRFALIAAIGGCTALPPVQPGVIATAKSTADHAMFAIPGEKLEFRIKLRGITIGTLRTAIGEPGVFQGKHSIIALSRGETDGVLELFGKVAWECRSTIDLERGLPVVNHEEAWIDVAGKKIHEVDDDRWSEHDTHHDAHTAVARFRGWRSQMGQRIAFDVRIAGARLDVQAHHAGRDYIATAKAHAIRYEGLLAGRFKFAAWVSDDPSRVPLRFHVSSKWGAIEVELVDYQTPPR